MIERLKQYRNILLEKAKLMQVRIAAIKLSGFAAYAAAGIFSAFPPLVLMPTLTRNLIPEDFAKTTLVWSALALLTPLVSFGAINSASVRYFKLSKEEFANHLMSIISLILISFVILIVGGALVNFQVYRFLPVKGFEFIIIISIASLMAFGQLFGSLAVVTSRPFIYLRIYLLYGVVTVILVNFFVLILGMQIIGFLLGLLIGALALAATAFFLNFNRVKGGDFSISDAKSALTFGVPLMFHSLALNISSTSDRFIIAGMIGLSQLALYSVTAQFALLANFTAHAIVKGLQPRLYEILLYLDKASVKSVIRMSAFYVGSTLFLSITIGLSSPGLVDLIAGTAYRIDWTTTFFLVAGGLFGSWYLFFSLFIHFYERTLHITAVTLVSSIIQIFLCYLLVPTFGITGASIAYAASNCIMFSLTVIFAIFTVKKHLNCK